MSNQAPENAKTQRARILGVLLQARGEWVPLPEILALRVAQYGARIHELRRLGFRIRNRTEHRDGQVFSYFRLEAGPAQLSLFGKGSRGHRDDG